MAVDSVTAIKRLSSGKNMNLNINHMCLPQARLKLDSFQCISGVMRYIVNSDGTVTFPRYKYLVLLDDRIFTHNKFHRYNIFDICNAKSYKFNSVEEARSTWERYINNPVIDH